MIKFLKSILAVVIVGFLLWYLAGRWEQLKSLLKLNVRHILLLYGLLFIMSCSIGRVVQYLVAALGTKTRFWDMVWLQNSTTLLNYAPMKFGTLFRANYLKHHYGLGYSHFATFFLFIMFLASSAATLTGLIALMIIYGLSGYENQVLALVFAVTVAISLCFLFVPLPAPKSTAKVATALRDFIAGRKQVATQ